MSKNIVLKSVSGGVGKSFIAANLANSLFRQKQKVVLVEVSFCPVLPGYFGAKQIATQTPAWKFQRYKLHDDFSLFCLRVDHSRALSSIDMYVRNALNSVNELQFVSIIDVQSGLDSLIDASLMDFPVEVISCEPCSIATATNVVNGHCILNKKDLRSALSHDSVAAVRQLFGDKLLCEIHFDISVQEAFAHKQLLSIYAPESPANHDIGRLATQLIELLNPAEAV